jgi:hypothetical protein
MVITSPSPKKSPKTGILEKKLLTFVNFKTVPEKYMSNIPKMMPKPEKPSSLEGKVTRFSFQSPPNY